MTRKQTVLVFWGVVLSAVASIYFFYILPTQRERDAQRQSAAIIGPAIKANPRFAKVEIHLVADGPFFVLSGKVQSQADLATLSKMVKDTALPRMPIIDVVVAEHP